LHRDNTSIARRRLAVCRTLTSSAQYSGGRLSEFRRIDGGYMIYWLAGHTDRFKALVAHDGVFNAASMYGSTEELWFVRVGFGGALYGIAPCTRSGHRSLSPPHWKDAMLIVHSQLAIGVDLSEGYQASRLRQNGRAAKFLYFPDEGQLGCYARGKPRLWWNTARLLDE